MYMNYGLDVTHFSQIQRPGTTSQSFYSCGSAPHCEEKAQSCDSQFIYYSQQSSPECVYLKGRYGKVESHP